MARDGMSSYRLIVNGAETGAPGTITTLKDRARDIYQQIPHAEREDQIYQIYNDRCQLVEQSRWNRQWRLKWRKVRAELKTVKTGPEAA